ncbi:MAG: peptidyl-alpha-hydroxyglycine alpha-amidating lyase family protein [Vicinamibacteria bacterium]
MRVFRWIGMAAVAGAAMFATRAPRLDAQSVTTNPFRPLVNWGELPAGRTFGSTSAVEIAADGKIWVVERCGANTCVGSDVDPVLLFTKEGKLVRSFGSGKFAWPHGVAVDRGGNLWVTDAWAEGATTTGHVVYKFSPEGELLITIGEPGTAGDPPRRLTRPSDVLIAPNGEIYIVEAHDQSRNRVTKWAADGAYIETWGEEGYGPKQFRDPHALAMDSQGRIFVGDRYNNRIQIFDQTGKFLAIWTQFGRPSGIFIDENDVIYVADSESSPAPDEYMGMRNAGWEKGIRIGDARTGWVHHFIPDDRVNVTGYSGPEGIAVDDEGNLYGAEVTQRRVVKWVRFRR